MLDYGFNNGKELRDKEYVEAQSESLRGPFAVAGRFVEVYDRRIDLLAMKMVCRLLTYM